MMQFPAVPDAACNACRTITVGGSYVANADTEHKDEVLKFFNSFLKPEIGNIRIENVLVQTGIKSDPSAIENPRSSDYFAMLARTNEGSKYAFGLPIQVMTGKPKEVFTHVFNNAFPAGNISVEDAVA